jgi:cell division protein FtsB
MMLLRELRRRGRVIVGPVLGMALTGYFAYNLIEGDRGFIAWTRLTEQIRVENASLAALRAERAALKLKVTNLSPGHIDPDLLDERVRATLNLVAPNELVIMRPSENTGDAPQSSPGDGPTGPPNP